MTAEQKQGVKAVAVDMWDPFIQSILKQVPGADIVHDRFHVSSDLGFSTRFQFGDHLGIGYRFERYDVAVRFQHLSNGGMRNPNPGINFLLLRLQYHFG